jgi:serine O-acetyltransferase
MDGRDLLSLPALVSMLTDSYRGDLRGQRINRHFLPSRDESLEILRLLLDVLYPGYFGRDDLTDENVSYHVGVTLTALREKLSRQVERCLCYGDEVSGTSDLPRCRKRSYEVTDRFLGGLGALRATLLEDIQAAHEGDPAAVSLDEIVLAYPGLLAITVYRIAHEIHRLGVPMMPRMMTEWAHGQTGADIHPAAEIGRRFFLDHATGCVIGATTIIGDDVKLYQGVTLGALSFPKDANGNLIRGEKRHPTVENLVTIYANATVLGGRTVVGRGSVIGGSVFVTKSVPPGSRVALKPPDLLVAPLQNGVPYPIEFEI